MIQKGPGSGASRRVACETGASSWTSMRGQGQGGHKCPSTVYPKFLGVTTGIKQGHDVWSSPHGFRSSPGCLQK